MTPEMFRKLAALGLNNDQMAGVLEIFEDDAAVRKAKVKVRVDKWRSKNKPVTLRNVTERSVTSPNVTERLARVEGNTSTQEITEKEVRKKDTSPPARSTRGSRIPDDFKPDIEAAVAEGLSRQEAERQALSFCDYWRAKPGAAALKLDWPATWRTWFRRRLDERPQNRSTAPPRKRNYADVAADRWSEENGSAGIFGDSGNVEFLPPRQQQPRPDDDDLRSGFARRITPGNH